MRETGLGTTPRMVRLIPRIVGSISSLCGAKPNLKTKQISVCYLQKTSRVTNGLKIFPMRIIFHPVRFWRFFPFMFDFTDKLRISATLLGTNAVSPMGAQLKTPRLRGRRRSSRFHPRCINRRIVISSCLSFENRPIFGFGVTSDF